MPHDFEAPPFRAGETSRMQLVNKCRTWVGRILGSKARKSRTRKAASGTVLDLVASSPAAFCVHENNGCHVADMPWPSDPFAVPDWRLKAETRAAIVGMKLPNYRTRNEYEAVVALCTANLAKKTIQVTPSVQSPLPARESAGHFLAWLRETGNCGSISSDHLSDLYASHCRQMGCAPSPENSMRGNLLKLPGVTKRLADRSTTSGARHRPTFWEIAATTENLAIRLAVAA